MAASRAGCRARGLRKTRAAAKWRRRGVFFVGYFAFSGKIALRRRFRLIIARKKYIIITIERNGLSEGKFYEKRYSRNGR